MVSCRRVGTNASFYLTVYYPDSLEFRSDRDSRGFLLSEDDIDKALTGGSGKVRLLNLRATIGTAHLSTSGLALNIVIDQQLHTVPLRSLIQVLERESPRKSAAVCAKGGCGAGCRGVRDYQTNFSGSHTDRDYIPSAFTNHEIAFARYRFRLKNT